MTFSLAFLKNFFLLLFLQVLIIFLILKVLKKCICDIILNYVLSFIQLDNDINSVGLTDYPSLFLFIRQLENICIIPLGETVKYSSILANSFGS